jgi:hypothetical protein
VREAKSWAEKHWAAKVEFPEVVAGDLDALDWRRAEQLLRQLNAANSEAVRLSRLSGTFRRRLGRVSLRVYSDVIPNYTSATGLYEYGHARISLGGWQSESARAVSQGRWMKQGGRPYNVGCGRYQAVFSHEAAGHGCQYAVPGETASNLFRFQAFLSENPQYNQTWFRQNISHYAAVQHASTARWDTHEAWAELVAHYLSADYTPGSLPLEVTGFLDRVMEVVR